MFPLSNERYQMILDILSKDASYTPKTLESTLQKDMQVMLSFMGVPTFRANVGTVGGSRRTGLPKGYPDLHCIVGGQYFAIELKRPYSRGYNQTEDQKKMQAVIEQAGGVYILARRLHTVYDVIMAKMEGVAVDDKQAK